MLPVPDGLPFTLHWYVGLLPPPDGVAVKVTLLPAHTEPDGLWPIETVGVMEPEMLMVKVFELTTVAVTQAALLVNTHRTESLLFKLLLVNVVPVPAFAPFTSHWYVGAVPPLVATAVNVTLVPGHT